ncbi:MAG: hypothetical protein JXL80_05360 [Planctomycetes bacterium]|nr:hypothetical protein [Planctomycetota bacterium]
MTPRLKAFLHSPFKLTLASHLLVSLATGVVLISLELGRNSTPGSTWRVSGAAELFRPVYNHPDFFLWLLVAPPALLMILSLVIGLVFGRWGLPGHLQGRAVYCVPVLSVLYVLAGTIIMTPIGGLTLKDAPRMVADLFGSTSGLVSLGLYAALMTTGVGLGWAAALAVTHHQRKSGKWETIGYVERP